MKKTLLLVLFCGGLALPNAAPLPTHRTVQVLSEGPSDRHRHTWFPWSNLMLHRIVVWMESVLRGL
jgi:hypothetical protein